MTTTGLHNSVSAILNSLDLEELKVSVKIDNDDVITVSRTDIARGCVFIRLDAADFTEESLSLALRTAVIDTSQGKAKEIFQLEYTLNATAKGAVEILCPKMQCELHVATENLEKTCNELVAEFSDLMYAEGYDSVRVTSHIIDNRPAPVVTPSKSDDACDPFLEEGMRLMTQLSEKNPSSSNWDVSLAATINLDLLNNVPLSTALAIYSDLNNLVNIGEDIYPADLYDSLASRITDKYSPEQLMERWMERQTGFQLEWVKRHR